MATKKIKVLGIQLGLDKGHNWRLEGYVCTNGKTSWIQYIPETGTVFDCPLSEVAGLSGKHLEGWDKTWYLPIASYRKSQGRHSLALTQPGQTGPLLYAVQGSDIECTAHAQGMWAYLKIKYTGDTIRGEMEAPIFRSTLGIVEKWLAIKWVGRER